MKVSDVIKALSEAHLAGDPGKDVKGVAFDSRLVEQDHLFVAVSGTAMDGHAYISQAIEKGATVIVCEKIPEPVPGEILFIKVPNSRRALAIIASLFYGEPSKDLKIVGITGTNGKTTIATLLYKLHLDLGYKAGLLSTIEVLINGRSYTATHTTPDPLQINYFLREMVDSGCEYCFMEVSSHAVSQERIAEISFKGGIFTNLTHEHLDYHGNFKAYLNAKKAFFDQLPADAFAIVNRDDKNGTVMVQNTSAKSYTYSISRQADFRGKIIELHLDGTNLNIDGKEVWTRLPGKFNASNTIAVYGAAVLCGHAEDEVLNAISSTSPVKGRFETITGRDSITAVIDYAHTPDALMNVLQTISEVNQRGANLITVFGAGGNRDRDKRPRMAQIAATYSHRVIFTSDNPRNEDPERIIDEMMSGLTGEQKSGSLRIIDRKEAIKTACMLATPGDIILVAGKGHEKYQEIKGKRHPFDDLEITKSNLK